jgi:hypothetical protein
MAMNSRPLLGLGLGLVYVLYTPSIPYTLRLPQTFSPFLRCDAPLKEHGQCQRH